MTAQKKAIELQNEVALKNEVPTQTANDRFKSESSTDHENSFTITKIHRGKQPQKLEERLIDESMQVSKKRDKQK